MAGLLELVDDRTGILTRSEPLRDRPQRVAGTHRDGGHVRRSRAALGGGEGGAPERGTRLRHHQHEQDAHQSHDDAPAPVDHSCGRDHPVDRARRGSRRAGRSRLVGDGGHVRSPESGPHPSPPRRTRGCDTYVWSLTARRPVTRAGAPRRRSLRTPVRIRPRTPVRRQALEQDFPNRCLYRTHDRATVPE